MKPVCLVTGAGPEGGTGAEIARRFAQEYKVAMLARNAANIEDLAGKYAARAYGCDAGDLDAPPVIGGNFCCPPSVRDGTE